MSRAVVVLLFGGIFSVMSMVGHASEEAFSPFVKLYADSSKQPKASNVEEEIISCIDKLFYQESQIPKNPNLIPIKSDLGEYSPPCEVFWAKIERIQDIEEIERILKAKIETYRDPSGKKLRAQINFAIFFKEKIAELVRSKPEKAKYLPKFRKLVQLLFYPCIGINDLDEKSKKEVRASWWHWFHDDKYLDKILEQQNITEERYAEFLDAFSQTMDHF